MQLGILMTRGLVFVLACGTIASMLMTGCKKAAPPPVVGNTPANPGPGKAPDIDPSDKYASAKGLFRAQCSRCHSTEAPADAPGGGGKMRGGRGPNLAKIAADSKHTKAWISDHIRDPQAHNPDSRMPKFDDKKLKSDDLKTLVNYLATLKG